VPADLALAIAAGAAGHDRDGSFPHEAFELLTSAGLVGLVTPTAVGGGGAGLARATRAVTDLGWADPSVALVMALHYLFHAVLRDPATTWPPKARELVQRTAVTEGALLNALSVEPDLGTPMRGGLPATVAERKPDGYRLTGRKIYSTGAPRLRWMMVSARVEDAPAGIPGEGPFFGTFLLAAGTPGYRVEPTWDHLGLRASRSDDVVFDGALIPHDLVLEIREAARRAPVPAAAQVWGSVLIAAVYQGVARAARDWLTRYLNERTPTNLGAPLASLPRFQETVGRIEALLHTNEVLLRTTAAGLDAGEPPSPGAGLVKQTVTANVVQAVGLGLTLTGNPGLSRANPLERHYRDALCGPVHSPQADVILTAAGRAALTAATL
jgi:alkylation response protein AidB-like acyl-CoA dehydrogenase